MDLDAKMYNVNNPFDKLGFDLFNVTKEIRNRK